MNKYCQNTFCDSEAVEEVPVSVKNPSDQLRSLCATCHEAYTWGVQHGRISASRFGIDPPPKDKGPQPLYRVVYVIDINAQSPRKAAESAYQIMMDPDSIRPVFQVLDGKGRCVRVDLSESQAGKEGVHDETV
jgi:hypothetical protein